MNLLVDLSLGWSCGDLSYVLGLLGGLGLVAAWQPLFDQKFRTGLYSEIFQKDKIPYLIKNFGMCQVTNQASLYSEKDKNYKMRQNFLIWKNPSQKIGLKNFDQNENLCETSKKNLRTNFDISLIISKIKESKKAFKKSKHPTTTLSIFT